jgi:hypothetical protein
MLMFTSSDRIVTRHLSQVSRQPGPMFSCNAAAAALTVVVVGSFFFFARSCKALKWLARYRTYFGTKTSILILS